MGTQRMDRPTTQNVTSATLSALKWCMRGGEASPKPFLPDCQTQQKVMSYYLSHYTQLTGTECAEQIGDELITSTVNYGNYSATKGICF